MRKSFLVLGLLAMSMSFSSFAFAEEIELKYQSSMNMQHAVEIKFVQPWISEFNKIGASNFKINSYPAASLVTNSIDAVKSGMLDLGGAGISNEPQLFPYWQAIKLPFLARSARHTTDIAWKLFNEQKELQNEFSKIGKLIFMSSNGAYGLFSVKTPITKPEDIKGKRILILTASTGDDVKAWGGIPVMVAPNDVYIGLQRGMGEALYLGTPMAASMRIMEIAKYGIILPSSFTITFWAANSDVYEELTPELKQYVDSTLGYENSMKIAQIFDEDVALAITKFKEAGMQVEVPTEDELSIWKDSLNSVITEDFAKNMKKYGVKDPQAWIKTVLDTAASIPAPALLY